MEKNEGQERTYDATPRRLEQLRKEGQILRSRDLLTFMLLATAALGLIGFGSWLADAFSTFMQQSLTLQREHIVFFQDYALILLKQISRLAFYLLPFFILTALAALISPLALGGFIFTSKAYQFQFKRINPFQGIKRIFSMHSLIELCKGFLKFILILGFGVFYLWLKKNELLHLADLPLEQAISASVNYISMTFMILLFALFLIAAVDVPLQYFQYQNKTKMTLQEIKDEQKETEGNVELKQRRRAMARQSIQQRLRVDVPKADVIVTNPTHYAVALKYDNQKQRAPMVIAKGKGWVAFQIREIAEANKIPLYSAPPLARSLFHTTEVGEEIPAGLYMAVALVLTYVYQLKRFYAREADRPTQVSNLPIPEELRFDISED